MGLEGHLLQASSPITYPEVPPRACRACLSCMTVMCIGNLSGHHVRLTILIIN